MLKSCLEPIILGHVVAKLEFFFFLEFHFKIVSQDMILAWQKIEIVF